MLGDGCEFRDIASALRSGFGATMDLQIESFEAPIPLFFVKPHVKGVAVKRQ